jgi:hypothetical protein
VLFVYARPDHTRLTVDALKRNAEAQESDLIIYSDAAKGAESAEAVRKVRSYTRSINGFRSVSIVEREKNTGLAASIIEGVTSVVNAFGSVIVVEDDLVTSPYFLRYMNEALRLYEHDEQVISIHGYSYPVHRPLPETFFLRGADCWGWATWKRGWDVFESDGSILLNTLQRRKETFAFDWDGSYANLKMLKRQISGKVDSWAIRWHASAFLAGKLTLFPGISLVNNIGGDEHGTHTKSLEEFQSQLADRPIIVERLPAKENMDARAAVAEFFASVKLSLFQKVIRRIRALV